MKFRVINRKAQSKSQAKQDLPEPGYGCRQESSDKLNENRLLINKLLTKSGHFIEADSSIVPDYQEMAEFVREISGAKYVAANIIDVNDNGYYTRALSGISDFVLLSTRILGFNLLNYKWDHPDNRIELSIQNTIIKYRNLREITGKSLPGQVVKIIENQFSLGEIVVLSIIRERKLLGDFVLLFGKGSSLQNEHLTELYAHLVGQFLTRKRIEEMLNLRMNEMERFQKLTVDREIMMIELKKEVNDLLRQLGKEPRYTIVSETDRTSQPDK
jgi:hypothetical protein